MQNKNIVIDRGNSSFKIGIFEGADLLEVVVLKKKKEVVSLVSKQRPSFILLSSVVKKNKKLLKKLAEFSKVTRLSHSTPLPFKNQYNTPQTLGPDRIAAVAAAYDKFKGKDCLVIDAGTCITYDFIEKSGVYKGGAISPGIKMRFEALNHFTSKLPLVTRVEEAHLTGESTKSSIESGVTNGVLAEVEGMIAKYKVKYPKMKVVICGGDSNFFESKLKGHIFAVANFVLIGLNRILLHNTNNFEDLH